MATARSQNGDQNFVDVVVVGAGMSGLCAAYEIIKRENDYRVVVLEAKGLYYIKSQLIIDRDGGQFSEYLDHARFSRLLRFSKISRQITNRLRDAKDMAVRPTDNCSLYTAARKFLDY